jgi:putative phosphoesterase
MRILILADIHGNWAALEAIREPHDLCICLGDLVDYGPEPRPCVQWVRGSCQYTIRGNHDHAVAQNLVTSGDCGYRYLANATRPLTWQALETEDKSFLARLPLTQYLRLDDHDFFLVHATPRDPLDEVLLDDPAGWERRVQGIPAQFICVGHTHRQFALRINGRTILNPGSVGQPRDGDPRAAYAVIDDGRIELKRVEYDVDRTVAALDQSPLPSNAKEMAAHVLRTGGDMPNGRHLEPACQLAAQAS